MKTLARCALLLGALASAPHAQNDAPPPPAPALAVIATIPTYALLAEEIGAELVELTSICRPGQDLHSVTATPAFMARVRGAELLLYTGLDAELWLDGMLRGAGAVKLLPGNVDAIVMSATATLKEIPAVLDRSQGDVHAFGNPHVWTDPLVVRDMATIVADALVRHRPRHEAEIRAREAAFKLRITRALVRWLTDYNELRGVEVVSYHPSWRYLLDRFGVVRAGTIEPKPRVVPTTGHLTQLVETMQAKQVGIVIREPWQAPQAADFVAERTGAVVLELSTLPGWPAGTGIIEHFEHNLAELAQAAGLEPSPVED